MVAEDRSNRVAEAAKRRIALENEMRKQLEAKARERALAQKRAIEAREQAELELQQKNQEQLRQLQKRWEEADAHVTELRQQAYRDAGSRVGKWANRRTAAMSATQLMDDKKQKRINDAFEQKEARIKAWREVREEEARQRALDNSRARATVSRKLAEDLKMRDSRLEEAMQEAERRRVRLEEEKQIRHQEIVDRMDQRELDAWSVRVRVMEQSASQRSLWEKQLKAKAERGEVVLQRTRDLIVQNVRKNDVWRIAGATGLAPSASTSSLF